MSKCRSLRASAIACLSLFERPQPTAQCRPARHSTGQHVMLHAWHSMGSTAASAAHLAWPARPPASVRCTPPGWAQPRRSGRPGQQPGCGWGRRRWRDPQRTAGSRGAPCSLQTGRGLGARGGIVESRIEGVFLGKGWLRCQASTVCLLDITVQCSILSSDRLPQLTYIMHMPISAEHCRRWTARAWEGAGQELDLHSTAQHSTA